MTPYRRLPHTADLRLEITGSGFPQLVENAGKALTALLTDRRKVRKTLSRAIIIEGENPEELLVNWLNELIYWFEVQKILFADFNFEKLVKGQMKVTAHGEEFSPQKHILKDKPKAATYHLLNVEKNADRYIARVVLDS